MDRVVIEQVSAGGLLAELRACDLAERRAGARRLLIATEWVTLHPAIGAVPPELRRCLVDDQLNVGMDAIAEFAAAHGVSTAAGRDVLVDAVELRDRLPQCWRLVQQLTIPAWKARLVAAASRDLGTEAAAFLDSHAALLAGKLTARAVHRLALMALARYEPDRVVEPTTRRWITIAADRSGLDGAGWIDGRLEVPDALDLEAAIRTIADNLATGGCTDTLDVRRAHAVGVLARRALGQQPLLDEGHPVTGPDQGATLDAVTRQQTPGSPAFPAGTPRGDDGTASLSGAASPPAQPDVAGESTTVSTIKADATVRYTATDNSNSAVPEPEHWVSTTATRTVKATIGDGRPVTLYVHLSADQLRGSNATSDGGANGEGSTSRLAELGTTGQLVTVEQIRDWCGTTGSITIRPVIDLNTDRSISGYKPTDLQHEHIALRDRTCVFPHCTRPARPTPQASTGQFTTDADHIEPYAAGGDTSTTNLACLCRRHHLLKTHTTWTYQAIGPAEYLWRSPHGHHYLRTTTGTVALARPPSTAAQPAA